VFEPYLDFLYFFLENSFLKQIVFGAMDL
jgi:hypothetical protein